MNLFADLNLGTTNGYTLLYVNVAFARSSRFIDQSTTCSLFIRPSISSLVFTINICMRPKATRYSLLVDFTTVINV